MRFARWMPALAAGLCAATAGTVAQASGLPSYGAFMASYILPDSNRNADHGWGGQLTYGIPLSNMAALELALHGNTSRQQTNAQLYDRAYGLGVDARFGPQDWFTSPYLVMGVGAMLEDIQLQETTSPYANLGLGVIQQLNSSGLSMRLEARLFHVVNDESVAGQDSLQDGRIHIGLQQDFGPRPAPPSVQAVVPAAPVVPTADGDGDGIPDAQDQCPATPAGLAVGPDGCVTDADGDGVIDAMDACAQTPAGVVVDARGCVADSDGDGVPDNQDACPNTLTQFRVDERGCAIQQSAILEQVHFAVGTANLDINARTLLNDVTLCLKGQPSMRLELVGHTDDQGSQQYNLTLSQRRAAAVRDFLIADGIDPARLTSEGYGEFQPIAENTSAEGRERNRRVEVKVTNQ